ncbi:LysR family transcriptional regulator [Xenorhabdus bharatensis]|uniref:LysR family transcriptional regulator n=1 Tax=Xenorhabdus bharatensis TaxID=3136256 RepID=UPI0030F4B18B
MMDTLKSLKVFCEVVEMNSFSGAAKQLGISTVMVSKHIAHLEVTQQTRLLNRTSRSISLTDSGRLYYKSCREALDILEEAEVMLGHHNGSVSGTLRVTAPQWFSNPQFAHLLIDFQNAYPKVNFELILDNQRLDLVAGRYDLALRVTDKLSPTLIVRPLTKIDFMLVGSPSYFAKMGYPQSTQDLNLHSLILPILSEIDGLEVRKDQEVNNIGGIRPLRTNDTTLSLQLALTGSRLAYLPYWIIADELKTGRLQLAINNVAFSRTLYAAYKNRSFLAPKIRAFIDFLAVRLADLELTKCSDL